MAPTSAPAATREAPPAHNAEPRTSPRRPSPARPASVTPTDDEILGLAPATPDARHEDPWRDDADSAPVSEPANSAANAQEVAAPEASTAAAPDPESLRAALDANPDLRRAWDDAQAYRETFATPEEARAATTLLADLDRLDALFFSRRPEDHAELARSVAQLDPAAFASLAQAINAYVNSQPRARDGVVGAQHAVPGTSASRNPSHPSPPSASDPAVIPSETRNLSSTPAPARNASPSTQENRQQDAGATPTQTQSDFFHATNAAAVQSVLDAIETQVDRLLPENISKSARNRVVGEIYRELDTTLRSNRQLSQQMREAFRSGTLDADHQRAVVSLVTGRARQALPGVAKRVLNEWTSTVVAAHNDRRARQQAAERRVDIAGSSGTGSEGPRSMAPREVDYKRMSDSDILNL